MHNARLETSERLARVHEVLKDGEEHSTLDLVQRAGVCAVNSCVAELRECGAEIGCRMIVSPDTGKRTFLYRMTRRAPEPRAEMRWQAAMDPRERPFPTDAKGGDGRHSNEPGATIGQRELPLAGRAHGGGDPGGRTPTPDSSEDLR